MNSYEGLLSNLDALVGMLNLAADEAFELIRYRGGDRSGKAVYAYPNVGAIYGNDPAVFRGHITASALILGLEHFKAYLKELMFLCGSGEENDREKQKNDIEILFAQGLDAVADVFASRFGLSWHGLHQRKIREMEAVAHCLLHHGRNADAELALLGDYPEGEKISLEAIDVHQFGVAIRDLAEELWRTVQTKRRNLK